MVLLYVRIHGGFAYWLAVVSVDWFEAERARNRKKRSLSLSLFKTMHHTGAFGTLSMIDAVRLAAGKNTSAGHGCSRVLAVSASTYNPPALSLGLHHGSLTRTE